MRCGWLRRTDAVEAIGVGQQRFRNDDVRRSWQGEDVGQDDPIRRDQIAAILRRVVAIGFGVEVELEVSVRSWKYCQHLKGRKRELHFEQGAIGGVKGFFDTISKKE